MAVHLGDHQHADHISECAVQTEVGCGLRGPKAELIDRIVRPTSHCQVVGREDPVVEDKPRERDALQLCMGPLNLVGQES